jgi:hypothetical protein
MIRNIVLRFIITFILIFVLVPLLPFYILIGFCMALFSILDILNILINFKHQNKIIYRICIIVFNIIYIFLYIYFMISFLKVLSI